MRCAVLHGIGGNFCAGYDLEELSGLKEEETANTLAAMMERGPMASELGKRAMVDANRMNFLIIRVGSHQDRFQQARHRRRQRLGSGGRDGAGTNVRPQGHGKDTHTEKESLLSLGWLHSKIRLIQEESARMGVLCRRFGVPLIDGGTVRLPELIGLSR